VLLAVAAATVLLVEVGVAYANSSRGLKSRSAKPTGLMIRRS
jgi:hypothetical protein